MEQAARNVVGARADNTARTFSIRRQDGDGDVNLADVHEGGCATSRTRAGISMARAGGTARKRAGSTAWTSAGNRAGTWTSLSYVYSESTTTEGCHGTRPNEHNT